jgi:Flp pilus assembly protein TadD
MTRLDSSNWKDYIHQIVDLQQQLSNNLPLGTVLKDTSKLMTDHSISVNDELEDISNSYQMMSDYMLRGYQDNQRDSLYHQLARRLYRVLSNASLQARIKFDSSLAPLLSGRTNNVQPDTDSLRASLESFVSDVALLTLEPQSTVEAKSKGLYEQRFAVVSKAFIDIVVSGQWSNEYASDIAALILSPTIDAMDALTLCASVMMAALLSPDPAKVMMLLKIYQKANDEKLKQRALIGWVFALDKGDYRLFPEISNTINQLLDNDDFREELVQLQMQIVYCLTAEQDTQTIERDVIPNIMKNQNLEMTRFGIREKEENPMDEILHGDNSDKKIEEIEQSMRKITDMQKRGADIYFGGFSKMKRFGFFFTLSNWFTPFYIQHPGLEQIPKEIRKAQFMSSLLSSMPFCDSDKYSFALAMSTVYAQLPDNIKEMLGNNVAMEVPGAEGIINTPAFYRRQYLQDLYRFFRINDSRRAFRDPFTNKDNKLFLDNPIYAGSMHDGAISVVTFLLKRRLFVEAKVMLNAYFDENSLEDNLLAGRIALREGQYAKAEVLFTKAYSMENGKEKALKGYALASFRCAHYAQASKLYRQLSVLYPDKELYPMNEAIALINDERADEAVKILYELYYKDQNNPDIKRVLAWAMLCTKQLEKSAKLYQELLSLEKPEAADYLNAGYCAWFNGKGEEAARLFQQAQSMFSDKTLVDKFREDASLLDFYDIDNTDRNIMAGV